MATRDFFPLGGYFEWSKIIESCLDIPVNFQQGGIIKYLFVKLQASCMQIIKKILWLDFYNFRIGKTDLKGCLYLFLFPWKRHIPQLRH